jgi:hypothetical protein
MPISRKIRGILGIAMSWGVVWVPVELAYLAYRVGADVRHVETSRLLKAALSTASWGFVAGAFTGTCFALILSVLEKRRRLRGLIPWRVAWFGGLAGGLSTAAYAGIDVVTPGKLPLWWLGQMIILYTATGTLLGMGTLALARRADLRSPVEGFDAVEGGASGRPY